MPLFVFGLPCGLQSPKVLWRERSFRAFHIASLCVALGPWRTSSWCMRRSVLEIGRGFRCLDCVRPCKAVDVCVYLYLVFLFQLLDPAVAQLSRALLWRTGWSQAETFLTPRWHRICKTPALQSVEPINFGNLGSRVVKTARMVSSVNTRAIAAQLHLMLGERIAVDIRRPICVFE